ncbi:MAG: VanZ family protein [Clostridia bacterium]|nr:VanZ family protein [Clostridia bacterium]
MRPNHKPWLRIVLWALVVAWMGVIFWFSAEDANRSSETSGRVIRWLLTRFDSGFSSLSLEEQLLRMEDWTFVVRKLAHFSIFAVLGLLGFAAFSVDLPPRRAFPAVLILGAIRAILDEVHQSFVPGRSCEFRDMCIDFAGVLLGAAFLLLILQFAKHQKKLKRESSLPS